MLRLIILKAIAAAEDDFIIHPSLQTSSGHRSVGFIVDHNIWIIRMIFEPVDARQVFLVRAPIIDKHIYAPLPEICDRGGFGKVR